MKFKLLACGLACLLTMSCFTACGPKGPVERGDISYLYIQVQEGGNEKAYMEKVADAFETYFADKQDYFAVGKKGVVVTVDEGTVKSLGSLGNDATYEIYVSEAMHYTESFSGKETTLYNLSDIVDDTLLDGKTIEGKLYDGQISYLTGVDGKFYALPVFAGFTGLNLDLGLLKELGLLFADMGGEMVMGADYVSPYTNAPYSTYARLPIGDDRSLKLSPGPDGIYDTSDDGMPSSYEEFFYLLDCLVKNDVQPMAFVDGHYTNYLFQSLLSYNSTAEELMANFSFDSGNTKIKYVDSFNNGEPVVKEDYITLSNGNLMSQQYNKYLALKFLKCLYSNKNYYNPEKGYSPAKNTARQIQRIFIKSKEVSSAGTGKRVAMIIEGNYWYNEAKGDRTDAANKNREFMYMPLPAIEIGSVDEGLGKAPAIADCLEFYMQANAKVANNPEKKKLVEEFIKFFYTDSSLRAATVEVGVPIAVKYDLDDNEDLGVENGEKFDNRNKLHNYPLSVWNAYKTAMKGNSYVTPMDYNPAFQGNISKYSFRSNKDFFKANLNESIAYSAFSKSNPRTVEEFFKAMKTIDWPYGSSNS